jgi:hypothetical protein
MIVMRLSEYITIYLAVGASFGVSSYLRTQEGRTKKRSHAFLKGAAGALLWPVAAAAILFKRLRHMEGASAPYKLWTRERAEVEDARRALLASVNKMLEAARCYPKGEEVEITLYTLRESAEQYVELAVTNVAGGEGRAPLAHEMELARLSGLRGEDLMVAARCMRRRNASRILMRSARARSRLLKSLEELRSENVVSAERPEVEDGARRLLDTARLEVYESAAHLFELVEDEQAAKCAAGLLDAERFGLKSRNGPGWEGMGQSNAPA